jgi:hypothetical protein
MVIVVADTVLSEAEAAGELPGTATVLDTSRLLSDAIALSHSGL